jgi:hypothetical protein
VTTKDALAEASSKAWNADQRVSLRGAFTALDNFFKDVVFLRGKRVQAEVTLGGADTGFDIECPFKPKMVLLLTASQGAASYTQVPMQWAWDGNKTVRLSDYTGILDGPLSGGSITVDVFLERA